MQKAWETYEQNSALAGKVRDGYEPLLPMAHIMQKAQLEITIDQDGNFMKAQEVDKRHCNTIIPVTEASGGRAGKYPPPHPLCDALGYIAKDFSIYSDYDCNWKFEAYSQGLEQWAKSEYTHPKVNAVYAYVSKGNIMQDLISCNQVSLTEEGKLDKKKIQGADYEKVLVRFRVLDAAHLEWTESTWEDETLMKAYGDYYLAMQTGETDICYLTGKEAIITKNHPKGIVAANYGAKLISANDTSNFTFKGRFKEASEACAISYEASQKAHAALSWLSRNQGVSVGNQAKRTYIAWMVKAKEIKVFRESFGIRHNIEEKEIDEPQTMPEFRRNMKKAFRGHTKQLETENGLANIFIIGLDAATTGRLSITYYNELQGSDFLERMQYWGASCNWYYLNKTGQFVIRKPSIPQIINNAFGTERGGSVEVDDRILKEQAERLVRCMTEQLPMPYDLVHALFIKASSPQCYQNWRNRENVLSTACAVIAKYYCYDKGQHTKLMEEKGEDFDMNVEEILEQDRSYLFGKLLATLEKVESDALYFKEKERETNAIRLQSAFVSHPFTTWKVLEEALQPYYQQLDSKKEAFYKKEIETITKLLINLYAEEGKNVKLELNRALEETYLLGYYLQRRALRTRKQNKEEEQKED